MTFLYAKHESNRAGSDYTVICKDLKTIRGVQNRIIRSIRPVGEWHIYRVAEQDWYKRTGHFLVGKVKKSK
jgi:hypothetical protein